MFVMPNRPNLASVLKRSALAMVSTPCHRSLACTNQQDAFCHSPHLRCIKARRCTPWAAISLMRLPRHVEVVPGCLLPGSSPTDYFPWLINSLPKRKASLSLSVTSKLNTYIKEIRGDTSFFGSFIRNPGIPCSCGGLHCVLVLSVICLECWSLLLVS